MTSITSRCNLALAILAVIGSAGPFAQSQDPDRYLPPIRPSHHVAAHLPLPTLDAVDGDTEIIVESLRGVMILSDLNQLQDPIKQFDGIKIHPAADLAVVREDAFEGYISGYVGGPVSLNSLNQLARSIVWAYRDSKLPVVDVNIPPGQDITDGIIQVVVTESTIGNVHFRGNCNFDTCVLQQQTWLRKGQPIFVPTLEQELVWLNRNPYRTVNMRLVPGTQAATTDVVFDVCDENPISYHIGYADNGPRTTAQDRISVGFDYANFLGKEHRLSYQYTTDADLAGVVNVHSLNYEAPIFENRDSVSLFATWGDIDTVFDSPQGMRTTSSGNFWQVSGRYHHTLAEDQCRLDRMHFGIDLKGADNFADFGVFPALSSGPEVHAVNLMVGISSEQKYNDGVTKYGFDVFASPGSLLSNNHSRDFKQIRREAKSTYAYARAYAERLYNVNCHSDLFFRLTGQFSTGALMPTEQLAFGGYNSVRGYDSRTLNGDNGYILNAEYRTKPVAGCLNDKPTSFVALAFADIAQQDNWNAGSVHPDDEFFASVGAGVRYTVDPNVNIRLDYGVPLTSVRGDQRNQNGRLHVGATLMY